MSTKGQETSEYRGSLQGAQATTATNSESNWNASTATIQRWEKHIEGWAAATRNARSVLIGDLNLDFSRWQDPEAGHVKDDKQE